MSETEMTVIICDSCRMPVDLDSASVAVKRRLNKRVECAICRNKRIAADHETFERSFIGFDETDEEVEIPRRVPKPVEHLSFF